MQTMYRSLLGQKNWLQSRTQFQCCFQISRCASTIDDVKFLNKLARQIKSQPAQLQYWPLTGPLRILGLPDVPYRNNDDGPSQSGMTTVLGKIARAIFKGWNDVWKFDLPRNSGE